ncbi:MAG: hypothetical protein C0469_13125, partial [Cyanobacteria bacterium DS2.3.42]|nr:hypothetical protein [Cyanobacteria bacterium DS2.3.42]
MNQIRYYFISGKIGVSSRFVARASLRSSVLVVALFAVSVSGAAAQTAIFASRTDTPGSTPRGNVCTKRFSDEVLTKENLSYRQYQDDLLNSNHEVPTAFDVRVDEFSIGHIYPSCIISFEYPRKSPPTSEPEGRFNRWNDIMTFLKAGIGWTRLNLEEAEYLWGKPRMYKDEKGEFYTFDAQSKHGDEPNIYHLDFRLDGERKVTAYRIRGIGIVHPQWIDENELVILRKRTISRHEQRRKAAAQGKSLEFDEHDVGK